MALLAGRPARIRVTPILEAMIAAGKSGVVWDEATLTTYLRDPKAMVKGTKMAFPGLKKDEDIANVIAYLKQFSK